MAWFGPAGDCGCCVECDLWSVTWPANADTGTPPAGFSFGSSWWTIDSSLPDTDWSISWVNSSPRALRAIRVTRGGTPWFTLTASMVDHTATKIAHQALTLSRSGYSDLVFVGGVYTAVPANLTTRPFAAIAFSIMNNHLLIKGGSLSNQILKNGYVGYTNELIHRYANTNIEVPEGSGYQKKLEWDDGALSSVTYDDLPSDVYSTGIAVPLTSTSGATVFQFQGTSTQDIAFTAVRQANSLTSTNGSCDRLVSCSQNIHSYASPRLVASLDMGVGYGLTVHNTEYNQGGCKSTTEIIFNEGMPWDTLSQTDFDDRYGFGGFYLNFNTETAPIEPIRSYTSGPQITNAVVDVVINSKNSTTTNVTVTVTLYYRKVNLSILTLDVTRRAAKYSEHTSGLFEMQSAGEYTPRKGTLASLADPTDFQGITLPWGVRAFGDNTFNDCQFPADTVVTQGSQTLNYTTDLTNWDSTSSDVVVDLSTYASTPDANDGALTGESVEVTFVSRHFTGYNNWRAQYTATGQAVDLGDGTLTLSPHDGYCPWHTV